MTLIAYIILCKDDIRVHLTIGPSTDVNVHKYESIIQ